MNEYRFYKLHKCSYWRKRYFDVEANSYEEAEQVARTMLDDEIEHNDKIAETGDEDFIFDTYERIGTESNGGRHTTEIRNHSGVVIAGNGSGPE